MSVDANNTRQLYIARPPDFYAKQMNARGLRHWWFKKRQCITRGLVKKYYNGGLVLDIGCGNCVWNDEEIPTVGIDISDSMLKHNRKLLPSLYPLKADIFEGLPIKSNSINVVVITEVLEHIISYPSLINEIRRVLKIEGVVICSVPYSKFPGLWGLIFPLWCWYKGWKENDEYYLNKCGHKVNFNVKKVGQAFNDFMVLEKITLSLLTIFFVAKKE